jgi:hypothetical protein
MHISLGSLLALFTDGSIETKLTFLSQEGHAEDEVQITFRESGCELLKENVTTASQCGQLVEIEQGTLTPWLAPHFLTQLIAIVFICAVRSFMNLNTQCVSPIERIPQLHMVSLLNDELLQV